MDTETPEAALVDTSVINIVSHENQPFLQFSATDKGIAAISGDLLVICGENPIDYSNNIDELFMYRENSWLVTTTARFTCLSSLGGDVPRFISERVSFAEGKYPDNADGDGKRRGKTRQYSKSVCYSNNILLSFLLDKTRVITFEPHWLMEYRGDTQRLPFSTWQYLRSIMTNYQRSIDPIPGDVIKQFGRIRGLRTLVNDTINEGHEEMKRVYGDDVNLKARADRKIPEEYTPLFSSSEYRSGGIIEQIRNA